MLIADYILRQAAKSGCYLTPFQLIKLVFISHGRHLATTGEPALFNFGDLAHASGIGFGQIHDFEQCRSGRWVDFRQQGGEGLDS